MTSFIMSIRATRLEFNDRLGSRTPKVFILQDMLPEPLIIGQVICSFQP